MSAIGANIDDLDSFMSEITRAAGQILLLEMSKDEVIKYQILTFCFLNNIQISSSDLQCLHVLSKEGTIELTKFCVPVP